MSRNGFTYPNPDDCPNSVAEAVCDIHYRPSGELEGASLKKVEAAAKHLKNFWGTADYLVLAVEIIYEANSWSYGRKDKKVYRDIFKGKLPRPR